MAVKIIPLGDRVWIKRQIEAEKTAGGIYLPNEARRYTSVAKVIAVANENGKLKPNDMCLVTRYAGNDIIVGGEEFAIIREDDVLGKIVEE